MKIKNDYQNFDKILENYTLIFNIPTSKEELIEYYNNNNVIKTLNQYDQFYENTFNLLSTFLENNQITFEQLNNKPFIRSASNVTKIIPLLGLKKTEKFTNLLNNLGIPELENFILDYTKIQKELTFLSEKNLLPIQSYNFVISLIAKMIQFKLKAVVEELFNHTQVEKNNTISISKVNIDKGYRMVKENKRKSIYNNEIENSMFTEEGLNQLKIGKRLLSKNKMGSYNMSEVAQPIFNLIHEMSDIKEYSNSKQYITVYPLFREIYPERLMYLNEAEFNYADEEKYINFEKYQIGTIKTILGVTR